MKEEEEEEEEKNRRKQQQQNASDFCLVFYFFTRSFSSLSLILFLPPIYCFLWLYQHIIERVHMCR